MSSVEEHARSLGIELAGEAPPVARGYQPAFAPYALSSGELIHLSGRLSKKDGALLIGKVGAEVSLEAAKVAAREVAIELLSVLKQATGDLDRVNRIVRLLVMVNGAPGFNEPHRVADGASELFVEVFGAGGSHARSAMVAAELPFGAAVEIDLVAEIVGQAADSNSSTGDGASAAAPKGRSLLAGQDAGIARAEAWARDNIERDFSMDELASVAGLTPRTFARRLASVCGLSPVKFAQRIRIDAAETLLVTTRLTVDEVARRVGYSEPSTLRRIIRREARPSPAELRRRG